MSRQWHEKQGASERIKTVRTMIAATKRLGMKPPKTMTRYLAALEKIKSWNRKEALAMEKLKRYRAMEKRYVKKLFEGGSKDGEEHRPID